MRTWDMKAHHSWGDNIGWFNVETLQLCGHTTPLVETGDEILCEMRSGKVGKFKVTEVEPCGDPPDMWFAKSEFSGYVEKPSESRPHD